ncbi:hypothetical protein GCM10022198_00530 [Klugiella xanthotipulae]|uniref:MerR-like DNA binding protein n=2 Tax=Klugiella xanthotipulae TaxID=244735 RepID=A0A543I5G2_9MICO|nr:MerR-like DNA binding protein [Klugiella xanthotipulae]
MADLTQSELARILGVSTRTIVNWESEGATVPRKREDRVARALDRAFELIDSLRYDNDEATPGNVRIIPKERDEPIISTKDGYVRYLANQERLAGRTEPHPERVARRRAALSPFTESDLLTELLDRASNRGVRLSDWSDDGAGVKPAPTNVTPIGQTENFTAFDEDFDPESLPHAAYADTEEPGYPEDGE